MRSVASTLILVETPPGTSKGNRRASGRGEAATNREPRGRGGGGGGGGIDRRRRN